MNEIIKNSMASLVVAERKWTYRAVNLEDLGDWWIRVGSKNCAVCNEVKECRQCFLRHEYKEGKYECCKEFSIAQEAVETRDLKKFNIAAEAIQKRYMNGGLSSMETNNTYDFCPLVFRQEIERLRADNKRLHDIQDMQRDIIRDLNASIEELKEKTRGKK